MKRKILIPLAILVVIIAAIAIYFTQKPKEPETIKIGAILPLTGELSIFGNWLKEGIEFALAEQNLPNIKIIYEDNQGQVTKAVSAFRKLSTVDKVKAIITAQTSIANALLRLANSERILTIFTFADLPQGDKTYILNYHFPVQDEVSILAKFTYTELGKKGAILVVNDEFGRLGSQLFEKEFNGEIVYKEEILPSEKDFRSLVLSLKNKNPDFVFLIAYTQQLIAITKTMKEFNVKFPIIGPNVLTVYLPLIKEYLQQAYITMSLYDAGKSTGKLYESFVSDYKKKTGKEPNMVIAEAYEATKILLKALAENPKNLSKFFNDLKTFEGIFGKVIIDDNRQAHFPLAVVEYKNGQKNKIVHEFNP
jgi:branched-chain amino acid transport system substrate-binding protein